MISSLIKIRIRPIYKKLEKGLRKITGILINLEMIGKSEN